MRSKDTLVLEKLYSKIVTEKFYSYDPPQDKKTLMYDFYVINYLQFLLSLPSQGFRDLPDDISESIKTAAQKLYPYLKKELLDAVFFSVCAEFRHFSDYSENYQRIENMYGDNENITKFFNLYDRYRKFYKKGSKEQEELTKIFGVEKPSAKDRPPEIEKKEGLAERVTSYKAVNYALEQTGMSRSFFVSLARDCYIKLIWSSSYGGDAWCGICKGWLLLDAAEKMESTSSVSAKAPEAEVKGKGEESEYYKQKAERTKKAEAPAETKQLDVPAAIDHIYDLQHNTDTVFNKLRSYYKGGYGWIEQALTDKANVKSYYELLKKTSGTIRALAPRILYNKLGQTWEDYTKNKTPDSNSSIPKIKSKGKKCGDILSYQNTVSKSEEKEKPDEGNFEMKPAGSYKTTKDMREEYKWSNMDILSLVDLAKDSGSNNYTFNKDENDYVGVKAVLGGGKLSDGSILPKDKINFEIIDNTSNGKVYMQKTFDADDVKNNTVTIRVWLNMSLALLYHDILNNPKTKTKKDKLSSKRFDAEALKIVLLMPQGELWKIGEKYVVGKIDTDIGIDLFVSVIDDTSVGGLRSLGGSDTLWHISKQKLKGGLSLDEQNAFIKWVNDTIAEHEAKGKGKKGFPNVPNDPDKHPQGVYATKDDVMYLVDILTPGASYTLKDGYSIKWRNDGDKIAIHITGPHGLVDIIYDEDPQSSTGELAKMINNFIKKDIEAWKIPPKNKPSSSASGILNQGVYVTGSDIDSLLKKSQNESMELKDGFHVSYWKSTAVPSQKGMLQFRVFKELKDGDFKLIHNMTDTKKGNSAVATEINNAIKEYIKENPTSNPSVGFSPTGYKQEEQEEEEPEYSFDEEEDIEDDYINVKGLKFVFYSGKLDLGDGYMAIVGPKINGSTSTPDPFKMLEVKKDKKVIFSDRLYESDVEDKFQKVKSMAETINKKIKEEKGDIDSEHSMSDMDSDPPTNESFKGFFFRTV
jgi:hypothetical protein